MYLEKGQSLNFTSYLLCHAEPSARAFVRGGSAYPDIDGVVSFYEIGRGLILSAEFRGLPTSEDVGGNRIFGVHIHSGIRCTGSAEEAFADADGHYNPNRCPHPAHAGDLPPLFGSRGYAWMAFYTNQFRIGGCVGQNRHCPQFPGRLHVTARRNCRRKHCLRCDYRHPTRVKRGRLLRGHTKPQTACF